MNEKRRIIKHKGDPLIKRQPYFIEHWHWITLLLIAYDIAVTNGAYFFALWIRFDCTFSEIEPQYLVAWQKFVPIYTVCCVVVFWALQLYQSMWRFASYNEFKHILIANVITTLFHTAAITILFGQALPGRRMPYSYYVIGMGAQFLLTFGIRFAYRFVLLEKKRWGSNQTPASRVMLIGAGAAGQMIMRNMHQSADINERVCCIIDDNPNKWGRYIDEVPIVGGQEDILLNVKKYRIEKIYVTIPSATPAERRDILDICKETGCELKNLPGVTQIVSGQLSMDALKDVEVEDLLGRDPIQVDMSEIYRFLTGKVVMVTGGGGSIGSELCRQIAKNNPKLLIVLDIYENNAHAIGLELRDKYPHLNLEVLIGSVRDSRRLNQIFSQYRPEIVYHAAAHKHVPLMEDSPCEAIKNNAIGTYKTAYAAMLYGCKRFVLVSTDKAVNPTNIMGASKRLCEMIIQTFDRKVKDGQAFNMPPINLHAEDENVQLFHKVPEGTDYPKTEFVAVRFGNVLGSNGSVIPRFKEQIAKGGPVTVTHPDIIRYFMTIPEAASLVLQAGTYANGGEIFVLDMGSPVKIDALARNLIRLSGLKPDEDIQITYTGLRPGEKLYEEKLMSEEGLLTTPNHLIHIGCPIPFDTDAFLPQLHTLMDAAYAGKNSLIRQMVAEVVPTYHPAGSHGSTEKTQAYKEQMQQIEKKETVQV